MSSANCPGQDPRFMKVEDVAEVACPECGHVVEFWPDELVRRCRQCGNRFTNPDNSMKCLEWCQYAAQCMTALAGGDDAWDGPLCQELVERMKGAFGTEQKPVSHSLAVLELAQQIGRETGADPLVVVPAAILHDIGRACARCGSDAAGQGDGGRELAAELLSDLGFPPAIRDEVLDLIEQHHDRDAMGTRNGAPVFDADLIVNLEGRQDAGSDAVLERDALTDVGRRLGTARLSGQRTR